MVLDIREPDPLSKDNGDETGKSRDMFGMSFQVSQVKGREEGQRTRIERGCECRSSRNGTSRIWQLHEAGQRA